MLPMVGGLDDRPAPLAKKVSSGLHLTGHNISHRRVVNLRARMPRRVRISQMAAPCSLWPVSESRTTACVPSRQTDCLTDPEKRVAQERGACPQVAVVTGAGRAFSTGGDLEMIQRMAGNYKRVAAMASEAASIQIRSTPVTGTDGTSSEHPFRALTPSGELEGIPL